MTFSAIKHITYAAAGGFTAGSLATAALYNSATVKTAGAAYPYFRHVGLAVGVTAAVARAVDEVFKAIGWKTDAGLRLLTSHVIVGLALAYPMMMLVGEPARLGKVIATAFAITALAVNVIVK